jgi:NAD(P)-dependent dehydrogenase (short-subunit alcohol dehydrogenase family)
VSRVAVVTGAGRGIGREVARRLAGHGYRVIVTDVSEEMARPTADAIGDAATAIALDVRDPEAHRTAARAAAERGTLDAWINNAGVLRAEKAWDHSDDDVRLLVEANLLGVMWGSRAAVEAMRRHGGHIVNLASMAAFGAVPGLATYAGTKHGVRGYSMSLQADLDDAGIPIRVHAVCPDVVATGMVTEHRHNPEAAVQWASPRFQTPDEIATRIVDLLDSDRVILAVPAAKALFLQLGAAFPRFQSKLVPVVKRAGERRRQRAN